MPDYQLVLSILGLLVMAYGVHHQRKQTQLMESQTLSRPARRRGESRRIIWWRSPAILALLALAGLVWGPYILSKLNEEERLTTAVAGIRTGTIDNSTGKLTDIGLYVSVDGKEIYKYSPWRVMAVAFVWPSDRDIEDVQDLQKSPILDIRKQKMDFWFKGNPQFVELVNRGAAVNFYVVILPDNVLSKSFSSLRQAKNLGAKIIQLGSEY